MKPFLILALIWRCSAFIRGSISLYMKTLRTTIALSLFAAAAISFAGCKTSDTSRASVKPYPLDKCVVSGEAFEHGEPYTFVHNGQQVKLCCKDCLADFNKDPDKYMAKINAAKN